MSGKHSQKLFDHTKQSAADAIKTTLKRVIQKTAEGTGNLIGHKNANTIPKILKKTSLLNNSETSTN